MKGSSALLSIHSSGWQKNLVITILALDVLGPVPQKGEGPNRRGKFSPNSADFDDREGYGKTHCQPPVMLASGTFSSQSLVGRFP